MLKTIFWLYSWMHFFLTDKLFFACQNTRKLVFSEEVAFIQRNAA